MITILNFFIDDITFWYYSRFTNKEACLPALLEPQLPFENTMINHAILIPKALNEQIEDSFYTG